MNKKIFLIICFIFFLVYSTYLNIFKLIDTSNKNNIYIKFIFAYLKFLQQLETKQLIVLLLLFLLSVLFFIKQQKKHYCNLFLRFIISFLSITVVLIISVNLSFFITFMYGIIDLNLSGLESKNKIIVNKDLIYKKLKEFKKPPKIIDKNYQINTSIIYQVFDKDSKKGNFYKESIINTIPTSFIPTFKLPRDNLILFEDYLIIKEINKYIIENITPITVKLLAKDYFNSEYIKKDEPKYEAIEKQDYLKFREQEINKQVQKIDSNIALINQDINKCNQEIGNANNKINILNSAVLEAKNKIILNESAIIKNEDAKKNNYQYCLNAGYSQNDNFFHLYSNEYCENLKSNYDSIINKYQQNIKDWNDLIIKYETNLKKWHEAIEYYQSQIIKLKENISILDNYKKVYAFKKNIIIYELGIFLPESNIKIIIDETTSKSLADYFAIAEHEFLHYASYISEEKQQKFLSFFEEALTEYFARKIIKKEFNISTNQGYPLFSKIIEEMTKKVNENNLQDIYFTKDQEKLENVLNQTYGQDFYQKNQSDFTALYYSTSENELKIANNIMTKIEGKQLIKNDFYSKPSEFK